MFVSMLVGFPAGIVGQDGPWQAMDYGPFLSAAIEVTPDNIACKGIAIPLDETGKHAMLFDSAELRWAAAWEGDFVELIAQHGGKAAPAAAKQPAKQAQPAPAQA